MLLTAPRSFSQVGHAPGERGYHAFYQLCAGADKPQRSQLKLPSGADASRAAFPYLRAEGEGGEGGEGGARDTDEKEDATNFAALVTSLEACGFGAERTSDLLRVISGLLHLSGLRFVERSDREEGCEPGGEAERKACAQAAELLGVGAEELLKVCACTSMYKEPSRSRIAISLAPRRLPPYLTHSA